MHPCLSLNVQSNPDYRAMTACDKPAFHPIPIAPNGARRGYIRALRMRTIGVWGDATGNAMVFNPIAIRGPPPAGQALCRYVMRPRVRS